VGEAAETVAGAAAVVVAETVVGAATINYSFRDGFIPRRTLDAVR
jgi:hypothetical protein